MSLSCILPNCKHAAVLVVTPHTRPCARFTSPCIFLNCHSLARYSPAASTVPWNLDEIVGGSHCTPPF